MQKMLNSGYDQRFRKDILMSVKQAFKKILEKHNSGEKPNHRDTDFLKEQRAKEKDGKREKWFKKNNLVMFIPITPGNEEKHPRQTDWRHPENKTCGVHWTKDLTDVGAESEDWR